MEELLSEEEREAETIFLLWGYGLIDKTTFVYMAKHLEKRSDIAGCYLQWLIVRYITNKKHKNKIFNYI